MVPLVVSLPSVLLDSLEYFLAPISVNLPYYKTIGAFIPLHFS